MNADLKEMYTAASQCGYVSRTWRPDVCRERMSELDDVILSVTRLLDHSQPQINRRGLKQVRTWLEWVRSCCERTPEHLESREAFQTAKAIDTEIGRPCLSARTIATLAECDSAEIAVSLLAEMPQPKKMSNSPMYVQHALQLLAPAFGNVRFLELLERNRLRKYLTLFETTSGIPDWESIEGKIRRRLAEGE